MRTDTTLALQFVRAASPPVALQGEYDSLPATRVQLESSSFTVIGSDVGVHLSIPHPKLDGCHAKIERVADGWTIEDLGSLHGTKVGGVPLYPKFPRKLPPRALIELADLLVEAVHGKRPFERFANDGWSDLTRARLLEEKAQRDDYALRLHTVEGPYRCKPVTLRPRTRPYVFGSSRLCEIWFHHEQIADEALSITATSDDRVLVSNPGREAILLGHRWLRPGESAPWPRLALLRVQTCVFALEDPLAVALEESALQPNVVMTTFAPESSS